MTAAGGWVMAAAAGPASEGRGPFCAGRSRPRAPRPSPSAAAPGPSGAACAPRSGPAGDRACPGPRCRGAEPRPDLGRGECFQGLEAVSDRPEGLRDCDDPQAPEGAVAVAWGAGFHLPLPVLYGGWRGRKMGVPSPGCQAHLFLFSLDFSGRALLSGSF